MASNTGIGPLEVLGIILIVLKLTDVINWSWLWVLSPFWAPFVIALAIVGTVAAVEKFK